MSFIGYPFPIEFDCRWRRPVQLSVPDPHLKNWLLDTSSLTERLQAHGRDFNLQLLGQRQMPLKLEESKQVGESDQHYQVRQVLLKNADQPWVFAHSLIPQALCQADLAELGSQPLGKILFNDLRFVRQPFQICCIEPDHSLLTQLCISCPSPLWGRRSLFDFQGLKIMVAEIFLPCSPAYKMMSVT